MLDPPISVVLRDRLFLGALQNAQDTSRLCELGITHAINCTARSHASVSTTLRAASIAVLNIDVGDAASADIAMHFAPTREFIVGAFDKSQGRLEGLGGFRDNVAHSSSKGIKSHWVRVVDLHQIRGSIHHR